MSFLVTHRFLQQNHGREAVQCQKLLRTLGLCTSNFAVKLKVDMSSERLDLMIFPTDSTASLERKKRQILKWLSRIDYITHHQIALDGILEGTGQWLLDTKEYCTWRFSNVSNILWLHGIRKLAGFPLDLI